MITYFKCIDLLLSVVYCRCIMLSRLTVASIGMDAGKAPFMAALP